MKKMLKSSLSKIMILLMIIIIIILPKKDHISNVTVTKTANKETITEDNKDIIFYLEFANNDQYHLIPIVYTDNADYYMLHDLNGNYDTIGTCFMEKEIVDITTANNYIINGHSSLTKDRNFTFLKNYCDPDYFNTNTTFTLIDLNEDRFEYQIIGIASFDLTNEDTYLDWYSSYFKDYYEFNTIMNNTLPYFINHIEGFSYHNQQLITLITCDMNKEDTRFVLFAYRKE